MRLSVARARPPAAERPYVMRQKLLTIVAAASLMLSAAAVILWVRSYWRGDAIAFRSARVDDGQMDIRRFNALSSSARLVVSMSATQFVSAAPVRPGKPTFALSSSRQPDGWSFGSYPAPFPIRLNEPKFSLLGLRGTYEWRRETDLRNYFPKGPAGKARVSSMFLAVPHWTAVLIGLTMPTWWWFLRRRRLLRRERLSHGLCVSCGYDLRASPQGERCPECGAIPVAPLTAT